MQLDLQNQTAVVLGGASGIGKAIAVAFAQEGAKVALGDIAPLDQAEQDIRQAGAAQTLTLHADVADEHSLRQAATAVLGVWGRCDHVVVAAGAGSGKYGFPFWNLQPGDWERVWKINVMGAVHAAHAFAPSMVEAGRGTFLFLASVAGQIGSQTDPPYSAAKAAVINFTQCAAKDLAAYNVRVNALSPGMVKTPLNRSVWQSWNDRQPPELQQDYESWAAEKITRVAPLGRWQTPEDMAAMAVFLASSQAANITGQTLNVDGGQVMRH